MLVEVDQNYSQLKSTSAEDAGTLKNSSDLSSVMDFFDSHPVIESCKAAWQLKLTLYKAAPYWWKSGTSI